MAGNNPQYTYQVEETREPASVGGVIIQAILFIPAFGLALLFLRWLFQAWTQGLF